MARFSVSPVIDSSRQQIGYKVASQSLGGGVRLHLDIRGGDWAKALCERYAAALEAEADAAGSDKHPTLARQAAALRNEIESTMEARAAANKARKAAKPHYRALG